MAIPKTLDVTVRREGRVGIIKIHGYITGIEAQKIIDASQSLIDDGVVNFVLNLDQSKIINSFGISILFDLIDCARERDGQVGFCYVAPVLTKTFRVMGLLQVTKIYEMEEEAIQDLSG